MPPARRQDRLRHYEHAATSFKSPSRAETFPFTDSPSRTESWEDASDPVLTDGHSICVTETSTHRAVDIPCVTETGTHRWRTFQLFQETDTHKCSS